MLKVDTPVYFTSFSVCKATLSPQEFRHGVNGRVSVNANVARVWPNAGSIRIHDLDTVVSSLFV